MSDLAWIIAFYLLGMLAVIMWFKKRGPSD